MFGLAFVAPVRSSAARAALRSTRLLLQVYGVISSRTNKAVARRLHRRDWPEKEVGAALCCEASRKRRSISKAQPIPSHAPQPYHLPRTNLRKANRFGWHASATARGTGNGSPHTQAAINSPDSGAVINPRDPCPLFTYSPSSQGHSTSGTWRASLPSTAKASANACGSAMGPTIGR